ncbi:MAG: hypothetical protein LBQ86_01170 [Holophagales bacterium]|nr:hypothetical protein [Holophagales bacterium]
MPSIRYMPKWLAFLIPITLSLALLSAVGCSSDNDKVVERPEPSQEAGIKKITISKGVLTPAFRDDVRNYGVPTFYTDSSGFAVTVTLEDLKASLTINGRPHQSDQPFAYTLPHGKSTIEIAVTAEDQKNSNIAYITTDQMPINTPVYVLDGYGGALVEGAEITLSDTMTGEILLDSYPLPRAQMGKPLLGLDPDRRYNVYATAPGRATSCFANFNGTREEYVALYCLRSDAPTMGFIYEAPVITEIACGATNTDTAVYPVVAFSLDEGANISTIAGPRNSINAFRVTALGRNRISANYGSNQQPIFSSTNRAADRAASSAAVVIAGGDAVPVAGGYYMTRARGTMWAYNDIFIDEHWQSIVVYDNANNRTEQRIYTKLTDMVGGAPTNPDLSQIKPQFIALQAQTLGVSSELQGRNPVASGDYEVNSVNPIDDHGGNIHTLMQFVCRNDAGTNLGVRGYEVWLSIGDDNNFKLTTRYTNFSGLSTFTGILATAPGGIYQHYDRNPTITPDTPHYYKVRTFNGNPADNGNGPGYSLWSDTVMVAPLQPFTTTAQDIYSDKLWPTFRFNVTNPALLADPDMDAFAFTLYLKGADGNYPFFYAPFQIDLSAAGKAANDAWGAGRPPVYIKDVEQYGSSTGNTEGPLVPACDVVYGEDGTTIVSATPFAWLETDGTFVVNTDSPRYRELLQRNAAVVYFNLLYGATLTPGAAYQWSIYGLGGGIISGTGNPGSITNTPSNAALFYKEGANGGSSWSFGSNQKYSYGSPEGFFTLIIDPDAN